MSLSDSSSLSSAPPTDDESMSLAFGADAPITNYFKKETPPPKRPASPPHEYVLADNPDVAFIVMFRARFSDALPKSLPHYGPQDIERGVQDTVPGEHIERLLCALIGLVLNRKKEVEKGHYQRALEEAVQAHFSEWPRAWGGKNPLHGGGSFASMTPEERLRFLKALILWSLSSSEAIQSKIKESYKQARHDDDLNQPLSVQPWGRDEIKRRYWLVEGQDDTHFRLYRESNPALKTNTWWSVAGTIEEVKAVAERLQKEKSQNSKKLSDRILNAVPRFEGGEEKRRRRDYRMARKAAFTRPEPGFSLYEGRTRGKKLKYTYSDDEDIFSDDAPTTRRSGRNVSGTATPGEPLGPVFTASGRQVRARAGGVYGESMLSGQRDDAEEDQEDNGEDARPRTRGQANGHANNYADGMSDESDAASSWKGDDESQNENENENENEFEHDEEEEASEGESSDAEDGQQHSLVVHLHYGKSQEKPGPALQQHTGPAPEPNPSSISVAADTTNSVDNSAMEVEPKRETTEQQLPEKGRLDFIMSNSAFSHPEDAKENISNVEDQVKTDKPEEVGAKNLQEHSVPPLEPSRIQNGGE